MGGAKGQMVDSSSSLLGHQRAAQWRLSRKGRAVFITSIAAVLAVVAVLGLVGTHRPTVEELQPAYPQQARFQSLFFKKFFQKVAKVVAKAKEHVNNANDKIREAAKKVVAVAVPHVCRHFDATFCPDAPMDTSLPPLDPISHERERANTKMAIQEFERATDSSGLPELDGGGHLITFDDAGYATNAHTLSSWQAHDPDWIYQGDQDDG